MNRRQARRDWDEDLFDLTWRERVQVVVGIALGTAAIWMFLLAVFALGPQ